jgi:PTH2 family peptidyl-tRNA hydrolase
LQHDLLGTSDSSEDELLDAGDFYKMVFVVNSELGMGVGKVAAQVAHATLNLYRLLMENRMGANAAVYNEMQLCWEQYGSVHVTNKNKMQNQIKQKILSSDLECI